MPKVVSSQGMEKFVTEGEHQTIDGDTKRRNPRFKPEVVKVAPAPEVKGAQTPAAETPSAPTTEARPAAETPPELEDTGLEADDAQLAEAAQKKISKKHRQMRQAEALATQLRAELADTEDFSKAQFNRARLAEERAQELQRELDVLKTQAGQKPADDGALKKPDAKDPAFYDDKGQFKAFDYAEKLAEYSARKAVADDRAAQDSERKAKEKERQEAAAREAEQLAKSRVDAAKTRHPDWDKVVTETSVRVHDQVAAYMTNSEYIGEFAYHLAKNPDFAERLNKLHPLEAIAELGELRTRWRTGAPATAAETVTPARTVTSVAPAPITPLNGSSQGGVQTDPSKMTPAQLREYDRERALAKRRR
jgi:hypothetical protein